jgi:hypothetical protein
VRRPYKHLLTVFTTRQTPTGAAYLITLTMQVSFGVPFVPPPLLCLSEQTVSLARARARVLSLSLSRSRARARALSLSPPSPPPLPPPAAAAAALAAPLLPLPSSR